MRSSIVAAPAFVCIAALSYGADARAAVGMPADGGLRQAAPAASLIGGPSTCPEPDAVRAELETLVPRDRLDARLRTPGVAASVQIVDLGVPYRVIAAGRVREYHDETRDCAYRARVAAVFVALAIDPADIMTAKPAPPVQATPPLDAPAVRPLLRLDLGLGVDAGWGSGAGVAHAGAGLRVTAGRGRLAFAAGAVALAPVETSVGGVRLRQWRVPADAGVRAQLGGQRLQRYGELGLAASLISERALDLSAARAQSSVELGVRAALGARLDTRSRAAPFVALQAVLVPSPPDVFALPRGVVGRTPSFWLGATAGASVGFF